MKIYTEKELREEKDKSGKSSFAAGALIMSIVSIGIIYLYDDPYEVAEAFCNSQGGEYLGYYDKHYQCSVDTEVLKVKVGE